MSSPAESPNFRHLVADIAWFGFAIPAMVRFFQAYAIRLGATDTDISLMASLPAILLVVAASLGSRWLRWQGSASKAVILPSLLYRSQFLLFALTAFIPAPYQLLWLFFALMVIAIGQGVAAVIFVVMINEAIPQPQMTRLFSRRAFWFNITQIIGGLAGGFWLEQIAFPLNYQLLFLTAFAVVMMSLWHITRVKVAVPSVMPSAKQTHVNPWRSAPFVRLMMMVGLSFLTFFSVSSLVSSHLIRNLDATEGYLSIFMVAELVASAAFSLGAARVASRIGSVELVALALAGTGIGTLLLVVSSNLWVALVAGAIIGGCWTAVSMVGLISMLTDITPVDGRAEYNTAYHQVAFAAIFLGPLIGTVLLETGVSLAMALLIGAALRIAAACLIQIMYRRAPVTQPARRMAPTGD
jgi:MFS family permease